MCILQSLSVFDELYVYTTIYMVVYSVTRIGDFLKFFATNFFSKVAPKDCWLLGYFDKVQLM